METNYRIFPSPAALAEAFAAELAGMINNHEKKGSPFNIAVSGGNSPKLLFLVLAMEYSKSVNWSNVHFFWVDERCVPPDDPESNFGMTETLLLSRINTPEGNIHRIIGEADPEEEALRYSGVIEGHVRLKDGFPVFDVIILGMGDDGHTASIFPGNMELFNTDKFCSETVHPVSGQKRVTLTGKVINNADSVTFLVTGQNKAHIAEAIHKKTAESLNFPAAHIDPSHGILSWFLDEKAGEFIW